jgi:hypothetical protein
MHGRVENVYKILVKIPAGKRPLLGIDGKENNVRMDLREIGWESVYWMHLSQNMDQWQALVCTVMNLQVS